MEPAAAILDYPAAPPRHRGGRAWFVIGRLTLIAALIGVAVVAYIEGQKLRRWTWDYTQPIHFFYDINNGYYWGSRAWESPDPRKPDAPGPGFLNVYDVVASQAQESADRWEAEQKRRAVQRGRPTNEIEPGRGWPWFRLVDWFNSPDPFRGWFAGAIAGLLFWFNPAIVLSAHGWPTWDMWVIPFFVWALYLACIDWWFVSGLVIAAAAMFKGQ
jgi:hypothetical protein